MIAGLPKAGKIKKVRPAVIVSNDAANKFLNRVQVVPLTSNVAHVYPSETLVRIKGKQSKAIADQLAAVSKSRLTRRIGVLTQEAMQRVGQAIKVHLDLE